MEILTIKVKNKKVLKLMQTLEELELIEIVKAGRSISLSASLSGSILPEQAEIMQKELKEIRNEWELR